MNFVDPEGLMSEKEMKKEFCSSDNCEKARKFLSGKCALDAYPCQLSVHLMYLNCERHHQDLCGKKSCDSGKH